MNEKLKLIWEKCITANSEIVKLTFGCFVNPSDDSVQFGLQDCIGGFKVIEIVADKCDTVFGIQKLVNPKVILGRPVPLADFSLAIELRGVLIDPQKKRCTTAA